MAFKLSLGKKKSSKTGSHADLGDSHVFSTKGKHITEDDFENFKIEVKAPTFDPHDVTDKIMSFGKILTGIPLYDWQEEIAYRVIYSVLTIEGATLSTLISRQAGKSEVMAFLICTLTVIMPALATVFPDDLDQYKDGIKIGLFAPQSDQVETTYNRALMRLNSANASMVMSDPELSVGLESEAYLHLSNGSFLTGQVASIRSKIESKTYDFIIIEEGQDVDSYLIEKSIEPMGTATNATIMKVGTTGTQKNNFWNQIQLNIREQRKQPDPRLKLHFEADYKKVIASRRKKFLEDGKKFHLNYERFVFNQKKKLGEDSDSFRLSYALIWALDSGMFITDKEWNKMVNKRMGFAEPTQDDIIVAGLDIGKDNCSTVLTIAKVFDRDQDTTEPPVKQIIGWMELPGEDYEMQHQYIMDAIIDWDIQILALDYTGVGKAVGDRLMHACGDEVEIIPYTFSRPSKSDMWQALITDIKNSRIIVPGNRSVASTDEFKNFEVQLKALQKFWEGSFLVCQKPDGEGEYDDYPDSLGLCCIAGNTNVAEEVEDTENPLYDVSTTKALIRNAGW